MAPTAAATALVAAGGLKTQYDNNNDVYQVCPLCGENQSPPVDPESDTGGLALRGWAARHFETKHAGTLEDKVFLGYAAPAPASAPVVVGSPTATTITLNWPDVYDVDGYQLERSVNPFTAWTEVTSGAGGAPTESNSTVTGLTTATGYRFRTRSVKGGFKGPPSAASATITTA